MISMNTIVLCTDFSRNAEAAATYAVELAQRFGGTIHLVHSFDDNAIHGGSPDDLHSGPDTGGSWLSTRHQRQVHLNDVARRMEAADNVKVKPVFLFGSPAREIVDYARSVEAGCIVIATHGRSGLLHLLRGSVAETVVRTGTCPVFTVHPMTAETSRHDREPAAAIVGQSQG